MKNKQSLPHIKIILWFAAVDSSVWSCCLGLWCCLGHFLNSPSVSSLCSRKKKKMPLAVTMLWVHAGAAETMSVQCFSSFSLSPNYSFSMCYLEISPVQCPRHSCLGLLIFLVPHALPDRALCFAKCYLADYFPEYHSWWSRLAVSCETVRQCGIMEEVQDPWSQTIWVCILTQPFTTSPKYP